MIHKIHTGEEMIAGGGSLTIYGFGGSRNDFSDVRFPGDRRNCSTCHVSAAAASHALANTTQLGESCAVCHGASAEFSVNKVHAR